MSQLEKAKQRILSRPKDYTYAEAKYLLGKLGFSEKTQGKTSGSRVGFYRERDKRIILLHKPHGSDVMDPGAVKDVIDNLTNIGDL